MSAGDVRRLMGEPTNVVPGGNGWSTWLYDDGRRSASTAAAAPSRSRDSPDRS